MTVIPSRGLACLCISANLTYRCCRIFSSPEELIVEDKGATATQGGYLASSLDRAAGRGSVRVPYTSPVLVPAAVLRQHLTARLTRVPLDFDSLAQRHR
jgi:hypothetical protein